MSHETRMVIWDRQTYSARSKALEQINVFFGREVFARAAPSDFGHDVYIAQILNLDRQEFAEHLLRAVVWNEPDDVRVLLQDDCSDFPILFDLKALLDYYAPKGPVKIGDLADGSWFRFTFDGSVNQRIGRSAINPSCIVFGDGMKKVLQVDDKAPVIEIGKPRTMTIGARWEKP